MSHMKERHEDGCLVPLPALYVLTFLTFDTAERSACDERLDLQGLLGVKRQTSNIERFVLRRLLDARMQEVDYEIDACTSSTRYWHRAGIVD